MCVKARNLKAGPPSVREGGIHEINIVADEKKQRITGKHTKILSTQASCVDSIRAHHY